MYPTISEYLEAIKAAEDNFDQLKHLRPVLDDDGMPVMSGGNFAVVFKMKDEQTGKLHAVKCFLREQEGRAEAYRQIAEELEYVSSTFLTSIKYLDKELFVDTDAGEENEFPVLLMDWVEGQTLDKYIREHIDDQYELSLLAYQFSRLAMWLMPQPFAHGDLKPDNILVNDDGTLVLVDYDGMYVPAMKSQKARELGSPDFRHPSRTESDFDEHIDDFSLASILLSLKAISLQPSLLEKYGASDRLLFSANDYRNLSKSKVMDAIKLLMQDTELASLYSLFILAASQNNLSGVSFRLFYLNRPSVSSTETQINKRIDNQPYKKIIKKELLATFQGKENIWHIVTSNGTASYLTQEWSFDDEVCAKGACKLNTVENDKKHVLFLFNDSDAEVGRYYLGKQLQGLTPKQLTEIKHEIVVFESWNPETKKWVPCVRILNEYEIKQKLENEDLRTEVTDEDLANAWTDELGVMYSLDRRRLLKVSKKLWERESWEYNILDGTKVICDNAFCLYEHSYHNGHTSITLPNSVVKIGHAAFKGISLSSIVIPDSVKEIVGNPFICNKGLVSIKVEIGNTVYDSRNGCNAIIDTHNNILISGCSKTQIPDCIREIGNEAFKECLELTELILPDSIVNIGTSSFSGCESLKSIIIPQSVNAIKDKAFEYCEFESIIIPDNVNILGEDVFSGCRLKRIYTSEEVKERIIKRSPEYEKFFDETVSTEYDFINAYEDELGAKYSNDNRRLLSIPKKLKEYTIKDGTEYICNYAFVGGSRVGLISAAVSMYKVNMVSIVLPNSIIGIGKYVFAGCNDITTIVIPIGTKKKYEKLLPEYKDKLVEQEMGWVVKSMRTFNSEEIEMVSRAEVVPSQYGNSVCFFMKTGGQTYIPLSKQSKLTVGDVLDLRAAKLVTLCHKGKEDIYRVIE